MAEQARPSRVLLVDDEPGIAKLMKMFLEEAGYEVVVATNGVQALRHLDQDFVDQGFMPDLIITDFMMPEMNGAEFCEVMQRRFAAGTPRCPLILMSALLPHNIDVTRLADTFVEKTGSLQGLLANIERLLNRP